MSKDRSGPDGTGPKADWSELVTGPGPDRQGPVLVSPVQSPSYFEDRRTGSSPGLSKKGKKKPDWTGPLNSVSSGAIAWWLSLHGIAQRLSSHGVVQWSSLWRRVAGVFVWRCTGIVFAWLSSSHSVVWWCLRIARGLLSRGRCLHVPLHGCCLCIAVVVRALSSALLWSLLLPGRQGARAHTFPCPCKWWELCRGGV
jgi:hypothetical protein